MRTYLILKDKARQFREHAAIQALLAEIAAGAGDGPPPRYSREAAAVLRGRTFDRAALAARPLPYERLDQLVVDLLLGTR
jgi:xylose isomerase